jgi:hypothetical protein
VVVWKLSYLVLEVSVRMRRISTRNILLAACFNRQASSRLPILVLWLLCCGSPTSSPSLSARLPFSLAYMSRHCHRYICRILSHNFLLMPIGFIPVKIPLPIHWEPHPRSMYQVAGSGKMMWWTHMDPQHCLIHPFFLHRGNKMSLPTVHPLLLELVHKI